MVSLSLAVGFLSSWEQSMLSLGVLCTFTRRLLCGGSLCVLGVFLEHCCSWHDVRDCFSWLWFGVWFMRALVKFPSSCGSWSFSEPRDCFVAIAAAMPMTPRAMFICFQFLEYGGGQGPVFAMRGFALLAATLCLRPMRLQPSLCAPVHIENHFVSVQGGFFFVMLGVAGSLVVCLSFLRILGYLIPLGGGLLKREDQSYTRVLLRSMKKRLPFSQRPTRYSSTRLSPRWLGSQQPRCWLPS